MLGGIVGHICYYRNTGIPVAVAIGLGYALMYLIKFITRDVKADIKTCMTLR